MDEFPTRLLPALPVPVLLPARATSPAVARRLLHDALASALAPQTLDEVDIMVTELVTNAVLSARTPCEVIVTVVDHDRLRVAVHDFDPSPPIPTPIDATSNGGRGLHIIEALAADWGTDAHPTNGKVVWFEVEMEAMSAGSAAPPRA
jgi:anti-sigma regulatory factor (Ser/Thr protein kinase)